MVQIRAMTAADFEDCARIVRACGHGELGTPTPNGQVHEAFELAGRVIAYARWEPDSRQPSRVLVRTFCVDPLFHGTGTYIRAHRALERHGADLGFREALCYVPRGHEVYFQYMLKVGYEPYAERDGTVFLKKELADVRP